MRLRHTFGLCQGNNDKCGRGGISSYVSGVASNGRKGLASGIKNEEILTNWWAMKYRVCCWGYGGVERPFLSNGSADYPHLTVGRTCCKYFQPVFENIHSGTQNFPFICGARRHPTIHHFGKPWWSRCWPGVRARMAP